MIKNGWKMVTPENIAKDAKDADTAKDVYYFFVDKASGYSASDAFSKQLPFWAIEEKSRKTSSGAGAPAS